MFAAYFGYYKNPFYLYLIHICFLTPAALSGPCWFCLGSPQVEKHLVISVGLQVR